MPSMPRLPNPPGTRMPSTWRSIRSAVAARIDFFRFNPFDHHALAVCQSAVDQRLAQTLVGVFQLHVLAHHADSHFALRMLEILEHREPFAQVARRRFDMQQAQNLLVEPFRGERHRHFVNVANVRRGNHAGFVRRCRTARFSPSDRVRAGGRCGKSKCPAEFRCSASLSRCAAWAWSSARRRWE